MARSIFRASVSRFSRLGLAVGVLSSAIPAGAAGFISVPASGIGPLTFNLVSAPTPTNGFSTQSIGGAGNSINDPSAMNLAVPTNDIANISLVLPQSTTQPPSTQAYARYNSAGFFLQTRPTGNAYTVLVATFRNDTGSDHSQIVLTYDQGFAQPGGTEQVPGLWVYYSLTGTAGTWQKLDALSGREGTFSMATTITLSSAWEVGANLYILWADDNADGFTDGNFTIDNLSIQWDGCGDLPIVVQPHNITIESCRSSNLTVTASGAGPITYQWYKGSLSNPIPAATGSTLNFFNAQLMDAGTYFVVVTGPFCGSVESAHVVVTINQDVTPPGVISAIGAINGTNVVVMFSEPMFAPTTGNANNYLLHPRAGGSETIPLSGALTSGNTVLTLSFDMQRDPTTEFELLIDPSVSDACGNALTTDRVALSYEVLVMPFSGKAWRYDHSGIDFGNEWRNRDFNDSLWSNGLSIFDAKNGVSAARTNFDGHDYYGDHIIGTHVELHNSIYPTDDIPVYYFRTFFSLPIGLSHISAVNLRTFVDDYDVVYLNDNPTPVHVRAGPVGPDSYGYSGGTAVGDSVVEGPFSIPPSTLVDGENFIAAKLFQQAPGSSDITFGYELTAVVDTLSGPGPGPRLAVGTDPNTGVVTLTWVAGSGAVLYEAGAVDAPAAEWSAVVGTSDGSYSFTPPTTGGTQKFYVLRK